MAPRTPRRRRAAALPVVVRRGNAWSACSLGFKLLLSKRADCRSPADGRRPRPRRRRCRVGRAPAARRSRGRAQPLSQAKGQPPGSRAPVVGVELHMHRDVGVCSIGHDELTVVLLLRRQRRHATPPALGLWNGRKRGVSRGPRRAAAKRAAFRPSGKPAALPARCPLGRESDSQKRLLTEPSAASSGHRGGGCPARRGNSR